MDNTDPNKDLSTALNDDVLLSTLKNCIEEVFSMMVEHYEYGKSTQDPRTAAGEALTEPEDLEAIVGFSGRLGGSVILRCCEGGAVNIAQGLLMMDAGESLEKEEVCDALAECANMVAGAFKTKVLDPVANFSLGIPEIRVPEGECGDYRCGALEYALQSGKLTAEIWIDPRQ